jgi:hypothetical protein
MNKCFEGASDIVFQFPNERPAPILPESSPTSANSILSRTTKSFPYKRRAIKHFGEFHPGALEDVPGQAILAWSDWDIPHGAHTSGMR